MLSYRKIYIAAALLLCTSSCLEAQNRMRPVNELINKTDPAWPLVQQWIKDAKNKVEVLPCDAEKAKDALYKVQVTTRSPLGAVVYSSGGLLIDGGWIRILGSGSSRLNRSLPDWNKGKTFKQFGERPSFLLIADDAIGGFFALNGGGLGKDLGKIYYLSPDTLEWENMNFTYSDFLYFCFNGNIEQFYKDLRWTNWKSDVSKLDGNSVYTFYPYLWAKEGKDINKNTKKPVPVEEQYALNLDMKKHLGNLKNGEAIEVKLIPSGSQKPPAQ